MKYTEYVVKRLADMNYKAMWNKLDELHKKTGRSRLFLLTDMVRCAVNYGAGYMDYDLFEMYNLTSAQRNTYLTRGRNNALIKKYNDPAYSHFFDNKSELNTRFASYIRRDWILFDPQNKEAVLSFLERHPQFIVKPLEGCGGHGVAKLDVADYGGPEKTFAALEAMGPIELEELIIQHPAVSAIYPDAINTIRAVTILKDGQVHIICTYFRIGNNGKPVDNFCNGGMVAPVDEVTGIVKDNAIDNNKVLYTVHPQTGAPIKGFQFPDWQEAMDMVRQAALEIPQMAYVGWDVAFSVHGPLLVEGNNFSSYNLYQLPGHTPDKTGIMEKFNI